MSPLRPNPILWPHLATWFKRARRFNVTPSLPRCGFPAVSAYSLCRCHLFRRIALWINPHHERSDGFFRNVYTVGLPTSICSATVWMNPWCCLFNMRSMVPAHKVGFNGQAWPVSKPTNLVLEPHRGRGPLLCSERAKRARRASHGDRSVAKIIN